jgi:hypothetical protein
MPIAVAKPVLEISGSEVLAALGPALLTDRH